MSETRHNPCTTCGACCRSYIVPVCGYDVWLISTRLRLSPESFLSMVPQRQPNAEGFRLEDRGPTFELALDKRGRLHPKQPCVFLVRLAGGHDRCGIYAHRPLVCQSYPMSLWRGALYLRQEALCPPNSWPPDAVKPQPWRAALQRQHMHFDIYREVVARWNARVERSPGQRFALREYLSYLLNAYDRLVALFAATDDETMHRVEASWPTPPRPDGDLVTLWQGAEDPPWRQYLRRVRECLATFYPDAVLSAMPQPTAVAGGGGT
jgi:Fe-S-cluster containining protein